MKWRLKTYLKNLKGVGDWQRSPFFFSFFIWSHGGGIRRLKQLYERERERALETYLDAVTTDNATYEN